MRRNPRRKLTLPEVLVWQALRGRRLDGNSLPPPAPDRTLYSRLYSDEVGLAVEIDGQGHEHPDAHRQDERRTAWLNLRGINVLRIPARDVLADLPAIVDHIGRRVRG